MCADWLVPAAVSQAGGGAAPPGAERALPGASTRSLCHAPSPGGLAVILVEQEHARTIDLCLRSVSMCFLYACDFCTSCCYQLCFISLFKGRCPWSSRSKAGP